MAPWMEDDALSATLQMLQNSLQMSLKVWNSLPETDPSLPMAEIPYPQKPSGFCWQCVKSILMRSTL